jgi:phycocyanobilin lyase beta subunit
VAVVTTVTDSRLASLIAAVEQADASDRLIRAVRALAAAHSEAAIPTLIRALGFNNPGAAVAAMEGLVQLGSTAALPILERLDGYDYGARAWAIRALAAIGDPRALAVLKEAAETDFAPSVRRAAAKGLGCLRWSLLAPDQTAVAQFSALRTLLAVSQDSDWALRYAAVVGLQSLAEAVNSQATDLLRSLTARLEEMATADPDAVTQARSRLAQRCLLQPTTL